jgi:glutathione peroxidase
MSAAIYDFTAKALDGSEVRFDRYRGQVLLVVNTASGCGFTPQYTGLEQLHEKYGDNGLAILGFPCNQFGQQEPGDSAQIAGFCQSTYGVKFQMFSKIDVNGESEHPLYRYLKEKAPGILGSEGIKWNFTKFLVDRGGNVVKRYAPNVDPLDISADIERELAQQ